MKNIITRWLFCSIAVVFLCSFALPDNQGQEVTADATAAQSMIEKLQPASLQTDSAKGYDAFKQRINNTKLMKGLDLSLIVSLFAIVFTLTSFVIILRKQKALMKEVQHSQKKAEEKLLTQMTRLEGTLPNKIDEIIRLKQSIFEEQERKKLEIQKEEQMHKQEEENLKKKEEEEEERRREEEASRPYPSKTYYANYKASVGGFDEEFCNLERKANSTVVIKTTADDRAVFSLVNGIEPTAFTGILAACEVIQGSPESYSIIETKEPGQLELRDGVWVVTAKVKIACL